MKKILFYIGFVLLGISCITSRDYDNHNENAYKIVVLGSSTAAGTGPKSPDSAWVNVFRKYQKSIDDSNTVINLAKGGYTTYHILPDNSNPVNNRPKPDINRNITKALSYSPDIIIVNLPSNDAAYGYGVDEQIVNFSIVDSICTANKIKLYISTAQPRNFKKDFQRNELLKLNNALNTGFGGQIIDFWTGLANEDGTINQKYNSGDGVHLNGKGHRILFERVKTKL